MSPEAASLRVQALGKWIAGLSERVATDDRHQVSMLLATAAGLSCVDSEGEMPKFTKEEEKFPLTIKQGCDARGGTRAEAAEACVWAALAALKAAKGE